MNIDEKKLAKFRQSLSEALQQNTDGLTKEEFTQAFQTVLDFVKGIKKENTEEWQLIHAALQMLESKLMTMSTEGFTTLKQEFTSNTTAALENVKSNVEERLNTALNTFTKEITKLTSEQADGLNYIREKADALKSIQGEAGLDADEEKIKQEIIDELTPYLEEKVGAMTPKQTTIGWGAHPLVIAKSGTVKAKVARHLNFTGAGVSSVTQNPNGTIDVSISGGGGLGTVYTETPSGLVNGSNKIYTTANTITTIIGFWINGEFIHPADYSATGTTITFITALDASLSGLPFTIIYA